MNDDPVGDAPDATWYDDALKELAGLASVVAAGDGDAETRYKLGAAIRILEEVRESEDRRSKRRSRVEHYAFGLELSDGVVGVYAQSDGYHSVIYSLLPGGLFLHERHGEEVDVRGAGQWRVTGPGIELEGFEQDWANDCIILSQPPDYERFQADVEFKPEGIPKLAPRDGVSRVDPVLDLGGTWPEDPTIGAVERTRRARESLEAYREWLAHSELESDRRRARNVASGRLSASNVKAVEHFVRTCSSAPKSTWARFLASVELTPEGFPKYAPRDGLSSRSLAEEFHDSADEFHGAWAWPERPDPGIDVVKHIRTAREYIRAARDWRDHAEEQSRQRSAHLVPSALTGSELSEVENLVRMAEEARREGLIEEALRRYTRILARHPSYVLRYGEAVHDLLQAFI